MRHSQIACTILLSGLVAYGEDVGVEALFEQARSNSEYVASDQAFRQLRQIIRSSDVEKASQARDMLSQELAFGSDPTVVKRIGLVLAAAPTDQLLSIMVARLDVNQEPAIKKAICDVVSSVGWGSRKADPELVASLIVRLDAIIRDKSSPDELRNSAVLAMGTLGPKGFDGLMKTMSADGAGKPRSDVFYSALAATGDLRSLPFLRDALSDRRLREGLQIQAVHAMGRLLAKAKRDGVQISTFERESCAGLLRDITARTGNDQLFGVAMTTLARLEGVEKNGELHQLIIKELYAASTVRQVAALDVLYGADCGLVDAEIVPILRQLAGSSDAEVQATAEAVLAKCGLDETAAD